MFNNTIAGVPVGLIEAPAHLTIPCEQCFEVEAAFAVGSSDHKLVCEACMDWGDSRRWWHMEPRQSIVPKAAAAEVYPVWVRAA
ncbi:hypothetical protein CG716_05005 [Mycolicibacterium sphagni]|uniref:Uncharacterized protein n=1 Tax=Mycolicibacterium sphagni TaxID=1786 RepID=A0A255DQT5_9MYCO|nr:hypothetical protein CG716_05005 [Mycolicibacterium sphagni]